MVACGKSPRTIVGLERSFQDVAENHPQCAKSEVRSGGHDVLLYEYDAHDQIGDSSSSRATKSGARGQGLSETLSLLGRSPGFWGSV